VRYADGARAYQAVDFDDLIRLPVELLERDAAVRARWQARAAHVLVDEYQDTNPAQYRLFRALVGERRAFTAVGDDDQAIYGWRGATIENLAQLGTDYPGLVVVKLEQNYRSTTRILKSANALIANNAKLHDKRLWSEHGHGDAIRVVAASDEEAEAGDRRRGDLGAPVRASRQVVRTMRCSIAATTSRARSRPRSARRGSRTTVSGGQSWFERAEIKDLVAYLRLIANPSDDPAFLRAVGVPAPRRRPDDAREARDAAAARNASLRAAVRDPAFAAAAHGPRARDARRVRRPDRRAFARARRARARAS
jgi:ATP-dependent DNA helicase Rep